METEKGAARTVSVLILAAVTQDDIGNYSCRPTEGRSATVALLVEEGKSQSTCIKIIKKKNVIK